MKARSGQVALYLVMTLVAVTFLVLMNAGAYLSVRAKNRAMNAGDAAALAVARYQGVLLNRIGAKNIEHLIAAIENREEDCRGIPEAQARMCLLDPLEGVAIGNAAARENGAENDTCMKGILSRHALDVSTEYVSNPELYPEAWDGAWAEYAAEIGRVIGDGIAAGPDNIDYVNAATGHHLLDRMFYNAVSGRNWCWFHFNAPGLLDSYGSFRDWAPLPWASDELRRRRSVNSEIYSLNLDRRVGSAVDLLGVEIIKKLTGKSDEDIEKSYMITNRTEVWYFYDSSRWRNWWEMDPDGRWRFPAVGKVKDEYDVRGCAAVCRVVMGFQRLIEDDVAGDVVWTAAAKPFGCVEGLDGELAPVTAFKNFVTPAFTDVRLVPVDSVGGRDLSTADPVWSEHVRSHLPEYLVSGPRAGGGCLYCFALREWERESLRSQARRWLEFNSGSCVRTSGPGGEWGGTPHGH